MKQRWKEKMRHYSEEEVKYVLGIVSTTAIATLITLLVGMLIGLAGSSKGVATVVDQNGRALMLDVTQKKVVIRYKDEFEEVKEEVVK